MTKSGASATATSPPTGGAFTAGLGESFSLDLNSGQATYSVALEVVDGVAGSTPRLKLEYVHGRGQGPFGLGWQIPMRAIERTLDVGAPDGGATERFRDGSTEIVQIADGTYRAAFESAFASYERKEDGWRIRELDGMRHDFGTTSSSRVADIDRPDRVQTWLLDRTVDPSGNEITYDWAVDTGTPYLTRITYAVFEIQFDHSLRADIRYNGRAGFLRTLNKRCDTIRYVRTDKGLDPMSLKTWTLRYDIAPGNGASILASVQLTAHGLDPAGSDDVDMPATTFGYTAFDSREVSVDWMSSDAADPPILSETEALIALDDLPLPGVLQIADGHQVYWPNRGGGKWGVPRPLREQPPVFDLATSGVGFLDMDGSGMSDMLVTRSVAPMNGYYRNGGTDGWTKPVAYPRRAVTGPAWERGDARAFDVDGDGIIDAITASGRVLVAYRNRGVSGWSEPYGTDSPAPDLDLTAGDVHVADMTGDGAPDLVRVRSGVAMYWPNLGNGRFGEAITMDNSPRLRDASARSHEIVLMDVDGDGCSDLIRVSADGLQIWINQGGQGFAPPIERQSVPTPLPGTLHALDITGRGHPALLWNSPRAAGSGYVYAYLATDQPPAMLATINNGMGLTSEITYGAAIDEAIRDRDAGVPWTTRLPFPLWVVTRVTETETMRNQITETRFRYHEGHFDEIGRRFQGFARVDKQEIGDGSRADVVYQYEFNQQSARLAGNGPEHRFIDRTLARVRTFSEDGSREENLPYTTEETDYGLAVLERDDVGSPRRVFRFVASTRRAWSERTQDERVEQRDYAYDAVGNVVSEIYGASGSENGIPVAERIVESSFTHTSDDSGEPTRLVASIVKRDGTGRLIGETRRFYDGPDFVGLPIGRSTRGLLTREIRLVDTAADFDTHYAGVGSGSLGYVREPDADGTLGVFLASERHAYDARGVVTADRDGVGNDKTFVYGPSGLSQTTHFDSLGTTTMTYDPRSEKQTSLTTPDGNTVAMAYDGLGRIVAAAFGGDTLVDPTRTYSYDYRSLPVSQTTTYRVSPTASLTTKTYRDGRSKDLQKRVQRSSGEVIVSGISEVNPWGQTVREFEPTIDNTLDYSPLPATGLSRRIAYDGAGRPVRTVDYSGGVSTVSFRPFEIVTADANDTDSSQENMARGQFASPRRERIDAMNYRVSSTDQGPDGSDVTDRFSIGALGELLDHRDGSSVVATYRYDMLGRRLHIDHRDAGDRTLWYDASGHVVQYSDATGAEFVTERDASGRLSRLLVAGVERERFVYDDMARGAWGRLSEVHYPAGSQRYTYNLRGQVIRHDYEFNGDSTVHGMAFEYNGMGKTTAIIYPDGERVEYEHDLNGAIRRIPGFISDIRYNARQLPTHIEYANGVVTDITYLPGPGKVAAQRTLSPTGIRLQDATYEYDRLSMLIGATDIAPGASQTTRYEYDTLYQVTRAHGSDGAVAFDHAYGHVHDRALGEIGEAGSTMAFSDTEAPTRPTSIRVGTGVDSPISYDANGAMTTLPGRSLSYDPKGQLSRVQRDDGIIAEYDYDHKGNRIRKKVTDSGAGELITLFIGPFMELRGAVTAKYIRWGRTRIALVRDGSTRFIHIDRLGSATFFTDHAGQKLSRISYQPYGNIGASTGTAPYQSFGLHEFDVEAGAYFVGRRVYVPELGRFTSPDSLYLFRPQKGAADPRTLALYTYAGNDPVDNIDPNGLSFWSVVGAIVGVVVGVVVAALVVAAFASGIGFGLLAIVGLLAVVTAAYMGANAADASSPFGQFMRGFLIGLNAGMNAVFASVIFGPGIGIALGVINFLAAFDSIAESEVYQGILGWSNWLMPMSWVTVGLGLIFFVANLLGHVFGWWIAGDEDWRVLEFRIDWQTGSITTRGGAVSNANQWDTAFNMGNFVFADRLNANWEADIDHEIGHSLNLAAFGSAFHFVGFFDEFVFGNGESAYSERLADGNDPATTNPDVIPMWS